MNKSWIKINFLFLIALIAVSTIVIFIGNPMISPSLLFQGDPMQMDLFFVSRLPRILLAIIVGMGLSSSGVAFQSLLKNPLADPYILGVSGGAALGGVIAFALQLPFHWVPIIAFVCSLASLMIIFGIAKTKGVLRTDHLLLAGVIFNSFTFSIILLIHTLVGMGEAHQILYLLVGSLDAQNLNHVLTTGGIMLFGLILLLINSGSMNILSLGEEEATQLGVNVEKSRWLLFLASSLIVGACVAVAGLIGFVGLLVPHMARMIIGPDHRFLLPVSALGGGIFLVLCDLFARTLFSGIGLNTQLPVGVITALMGGPFFLYLLKRRGGF